MNQKTVSVHSLLDRISRYRFQIANPNPILRPNINFWKAAAQNITRIIILRVCLAGSKIWSLKKCSFQNCCFLLLEQRHSFFKSRTMCFQIFISEVCLALKRPRLPRISCHRYCKETFTSRQNGIERECSKAPNYARDNVDSLCIVRGYRGCWWASSTLFKWLPGINLQNYRCKSFWIYLYITVFHCAGIT